MCPRVSTMCLTQRNIVKQSDNCLGMFNMCPDSRDCRVVSMTDVSVFFSVAHIRTLVPKQKGALIQTRDTIIIKQKIRTRTTLLGMQTYIVTRDACGRVQNLPNTRTEHFQVLKRTRADFDPRTLRNRTNRVL